MDIENIAVSKINSNISRNPYLKSYIDFNDKTPIWDGEIFVYSSKDQTNETLLGKVPVQVKGKTINKDDKLSRKFNLRINDIKRYSKDGGIVFIVVFIFDDFEEIYYKTLLPLDCERIIKKYSKQKTISILFKEFPEDKLIQADLFCDFISNSNKQTGTLLKDFLYIKDIEDIKDNISNLKFGYSTLKPKESNPFREITTRDVYVYMKPKGLGNPIPIEKLSNIVVNIKHEFKVGINEHIYYKKAFIQWEKGYPKIICSNHLNLSITGYENKDTVSFKLQIDFLGTLNEQLNDLKFTRDFIKNNRISINSEELIFNDFNFEFKEDLYERLDKLQRLRSKLINLGVSKDLELKNITKIDDEIINLIMDSNPSIKRYNIDLSKNHIIRFKLSNISMLLYFEIDEEKDTYIINDYFSKKIEVKISLDGIEAPKPISQFILLKQEDLLSDNLDAKKVIKDIKTLHANKNHLELVNNFLLEVINVYDSLKKKRQKIMFLMESLSNWLYKEKPEDYILLNLAQVKFRLNKLNNKDYTLLEKIKSDNKNNEEILLGIMIICEENIKAQSFFETLDKDKQNKFKKYPIYNLLG